MALNVKAGEVRGRQLLLVIGVSVGIILIAAVTQTSAATVQALGFWPVQRS